jgi:MoxR-like ATPase
VFTEGKLIQAMREGRPVVLDEVNLSDQQVMMRLQDILLKRPGQRVLLQENGNEPVEVKPGFAVIATANEASVRYHAREQLDPAFRDRFDVITVSYPDISIDHLTDLPTVNLRLGLANAITDEGYYNPHIDISDVVLLARTAHASQRLYALPAKNAGRKVSDTADVIDDDEPLLTDCITPRKMVTLLQRVSTGTLAGTTVMGELERVISSLDQHGTRNQTYVKRVMKLLVEKKDK